MEIVIQKLVVDCELRGRQRPVDSGREMERLVRYRILPLVEEILNELSFESAYIKLDKTALNLDLDNVGGFLDGVSSESLRYSLKQQILAGMLVKAERTSAAEGIWRQFIFLVKNGYTPWGFKYNKHSDFEYSLLLNIELLAGTTSFVDEVKDTLRQMDLWQRIAADYSIEFIVKLLKTIYKVTAYSEEQILSDIYKVSSFSVNDDDEFTQKYILLVLAVNAFANDITGIRAEVQDEIKEIFRSVSGIKARRINVVPPLEVKELLLTLQKILSRKPGVGSRKSQQGTRDKQNKEAATEALKTAPSEDIKKTTSENFKNGLSGKNSQKAHDSNAEREKRHGFGNKYKNEVGKNRGTESNEDRRPWQDEGVYVSNAGLVVLAHFLPNFFMQLGLLKDNQLTDPHKCVHLLQMLCGVTEDKEYSLALNKILCGLEPENKLKRRKKFRKKDVKEGKVLLDTVIAHWTALKNTSAETLQRTFLQRNGKLYLENEMVLLHVDKRTEDVLLDFLPWSFGLIKLSWMKYPVSVKWND